MAVIASGVGGAFIARPTKGSRRVSLSRRGRSEGRVRPVRSRTGVHPPLSRARAGHRTQTARPGRCRRTGGERQRRARCPAESAPRAGAAAQRAMGADSGGPRRAHGVSGLGGTVRATAPPLRRDWPGRPKGRPCARGARDAGSGPERWDGQPAAAAPASTAGRPRPSPKRSTPYPFRPHRWPAGTGGGPVRRHALLPGGGTPPGGRWQHRSGSTSAAAGPAPGRGWGPLPPAYRWQAASAARRPRAAAQRRCLGSRAEAARRAPRGTPGRGLAGAGCRNRSSDLEAAQRRRRAGPRGVPVPRGGQRRGGHCSSSVSHARSCGCAGRGPHWTGGGGPYGASGASGAASYGGCGPVP